MAAGEDSHVNVGFLQEAEPWKLESRYFPSKIGGRPAWLDLKNIQLDLSCDRCSKPCIFLCQLYTPVSEENHHRTIFVFVCKDPNCCRPDDNSNFIVFRSQLPFHNEFYPVGEPEDRPDWCPEANIHRHQNTCTICGAFAGHQCGNCGKTRYCTRDHQSIDWRAGHNKTCGKSENLNADILFPEYEIVCEGEILDEEDAEKLRQKRENERTYEERLQEYRDILSRSESTSTFNNIKLLEELAFGKEDKYFKRFKERLSICPDQVIRYDKGGVPLWIAEPKMDKLKIPNCEHCNGPRTFEFQILSTLLNYLRVDSLGRSLDWGVLLIYTCRDNCYGGPSYKKEYLVKQDVTK